MSLRITMLLTVLFVFKVYAQSVSQSSPVDVPTPPSLIESLSANIFHVHRKVTISNLEGFTPEQKQRLKTIVIVLEKVINSDEMRQLVSEHRVQPYKSSVDFWDVEAPLAMSGRDAWAKTMSDDWNMEYMGYSSRSSTVGYTYENVNWIKLNTRHVNFKDDSLIAQNMCHEFGGHKRGFRHSYRNSIYRSYSYPYAIGNMCRILYKKFTNQ